ncbi:PucR family transcriptional regulator [Nocardia donostiensis]|uniref:PucR C-terminal helix-turn-helix domain-containing protein n=1 Tax=Nocardia donostiensis TaxID=1538463 RepID=A0A1W0BAC1_9NOCA|nr:PucR family transcriptional regulator [Nocardia donostiensis]ONM46726.1 hypothetical protein B0T46_21780 [Nocardia donostiensis]OQS12805.1 hypothetical protein B0T36_23370 [Nocardia donostiensis]OQS19358.1 hypothetical protein B0T44_15015 [Nocardia donostiensis]
MIRIAELVEALGGALLHRLVEGAEDRVGDVVMGERDEIVANRPGALILGAGVHAPDDAAALLSRAADVGAAAVVLRAPIDARLAEHAAELGVGLLELPRQASWTHLVWLTRSVLDRSLGVMAARDINVYSELVVFADAAAGIVGAPVTIEDAQSRVLAYSAVQDSADPARISTIVGRRVPDEVTSYFRSRGVFRKLHRSSEPIWVEAGPDGVLPRLIIPVRAGGELLGSIWAVATEPVPQEKVRELTQASATLALHLLRLQAQTGAAGWMVAERLRSVLLAPASDAQAARTWLPTGPLRVVALGASETGDDPHHRLGLWESIVRRYGWGQPLITDVDGVPVTVVRAAGTPRTVGSWSWLRAIAAEVYAHDKSMFVAAGGEADRVEALPRSRAEAVEVSRLIVDGRAGGPALGLEEVWHEVTLERAGAAMRTESGLLGGPVPLLLEQDRLRGTDFAATLLAYLEHFRRPAEAARALHIHPNTLRYRMGQIGQLVDMELDDPRVRLALQLQLVATARTLDAE